MNQSGQGYSSFGRSNTGLGDGYPQEPPGPFDDRGRGQSRWNGKKGKGRGRGRGRGSPSAYAPSYSPAAVGQESSPWGTSYSPSTPVDQHTAIDFHLQPFLGLLREALETAQPYVHGQEGAAGFTPYPEPEYGSPQPGQYHDPRQQRHPLGQEQQWAEDVGEFSAGFSQHEDFTRPYGDRYGTFEGQYGPEPQVMDSQRERMDLYSACGNTYSGGENFRGPEPSSFGERHDPGMPPPLESVSYFEPYSQPEAPYSSQDSYSDFGDGQGYQPYDRPYNIAEERAYRGAGDPGNQPYGMNPYPEPVPGPFHDGGASYREEPFRRQSEEGYYNRREPAFLEEEKQRSTGTSDLVLWRQSRNTRQRSPPRRTENRMDTRPDSRPRAGPDIGPRAASLESSPNARPRSSQGDSPRPGSSVRERPRPGSSVRERPRPGSGVRESTRPNPRDERRDRRELDSERTKEKRSDAGRSNRDVHGNQQNRSSYEPISDGPSSVMQRLGPPSSDQSRPHSPRSTIESRLGPEEPRGSTIQSRLGPHPDKSHIHSRLGPQVTASGGGSSLRVSPASSGSTSPAFARRSPIGIVGAPHQDLRVQLEENRRALNESDAPPKPLFPPRTEPPAQRTALLSTDQSKLIGTSTSHPSSVSVGVRSSVRPSARSPSANLAERHPLCTQLSPESSMDQSKTTHTLSTTTTTIPLQSKAKEATDPRQHPPATPDRRRPAADLKRPAAVSPVNQQGDRPYASGSVPLPSEAAPADTRPPTAKGLGWAADASEPKQRQIVSKQPPVAVNPLHDGVPSAKVEASRPPKTQAAKPPSTSIPSKSVEAPKQGSSFAERHPSKHGRAGKDQPTEQPPTSKVTELSKKSRVSHSRTAKESSGDPQSSRTRETKPPIRPRDKPLQLEETKRNATPREQLRMPLRGKSDPSSADKSPKPEGASGGPARPQQHQSRTDKDKPLLPREASTSASKKSRQTSQQQHRDSSTLPAASEVEKPRQPSTRKEQPTGSQLPGETLEDFKQPTRTESGPALRGTSGQRGPATQESKAVSRKSPDLTSPRNKPPSVSQKKTAVATTLDAPEKRSGVSSRDSPVSLPVSLPGALPETIKQRLTAGQPSDVAHASSKKPVPVSHDPARTRAPRIATSSKRRLSSESDPGGAPIPVLGPKYVKQPSSSPVVKRVCSSSKSDHHDATSRTDITGQRPPSKPNSAESVKASPGSSKSENSGDLRRQSQRTTATQRESKELDPDAMKSETPPESHTSEVRVSRSDDHSMEEATPPRRASVGMMDIQRPCNPTSLPFAGFDLGEKPGSGKGVAAVTAAPAGSTSSPRDPGHGGHGGEPTIKPTTLFSKTSDQDDRGHLQQQPHRTGDEPSSTPPPQKQSHGSEHATPPPGKQPHRSGGEPSAAPPPGKQPHRSGGEPSVAPPPGKQPHRSGDEPSAAPPPRKQPHRSGDEPSAAPSPRKQPHRSGDELSATPPPRKQPHMSGDELSATPPPRKLPRLEEPTRSLQNFRIPKLSESRSQSSTDPTRERRPSTESIRERRPSTDSTKERRPSTDSTRQRRPSADSTREGKPSTDSTKERRPSTDSTREGEPSTDSTKERRPSTDSTRERRPSTESTRERRPSTDSTRERRPSTDSTRKRRSSTDSTRERKPSTESTRNKIPSQSSTDSTRSRRPSQEGAMGRGGIADEPPKPAPPPSNSQRSSTCTSVSTAEEREGSDTDSNPGLVIDESAGSSCLDKDSVFSPGNEARSSHVRVNFGQSPPTAHRSSEAASISTETTNRRAVKFLKPERLAEKVIGRTLAEQLLAVRPGKRKTSLLRNLYTSIRKIVAYFRYSTSTQMHDMQRHYVGFAVADVTRGMLQERNWAADSLFSFEVAHLHWKCQLDVSKWRQAIKQHGDITRREVAEAKERAQRGAWKRQQLGRSQPDAGETGDGSAVSQRRLSGDKEARPPQGVAVQKQQEMAERREKIVAARATLAREQERLRKGLELKMRDRDQTASVSGTTTLPPGPAVATAVGGASKEPSCSQSLLTPARHEVMITPPLSVQSLTDTIRGLRSMEEALSSPPSRSPSPLPSATLICRTSPLATPTNVASSSIYSSQSVATPTYSTSSSQSLTTPTYSTSSSQSVAPPNAVSASRSLWFEDTCRARSQELAAGSTTVEQGHSPTSTAPVEGEKIPVLPDFGMRLRMQFELQNPVRDETLPGGVLGGVPGQTGDERRQQGRGTELRSYSRALQLLRPLSKKKRGRRKKKRFYFPRPSKKTRMQMQRRGAAMSSSEGPEALLYSQFTQPPAFSLSGLLGASPQGSGTEPGQGRAEPSPSSLRLWPHPEGVNLNPVAMDLDTSTDDDEGKNAVQSPHELESGQEICEGSTPNATSSGTARSSQHLPEPCSSPITETVSESIQGQQLESIISSIKADLEREAGYTQPVTHQSYDYDQSSLPPERSGRRDAELETGTQFEYPIEQDIEVEETVLSSDFMSTSGQLAIGGHEQEPTGGISAREIDRDPTVGCGGSGSEDTSHQPVVASEVDGVYGQQPPPAIIVTDEGAVDPAPILATSDEKCTRLLESIGYEHSDPTMDLQYSASFQQQRFESNSTEGVAQWTSEPDPAGDRSCMLGPTDPLMPSSPDELQAPLAGLADRDASLQPAVADRLESVKERQEVEYQPGEALFGNSHDFLSDNALSCTITDPAPFANLSRLSQMEVGITVSSPFNMIRLEAGERSRASDVSASSTDPPVPTSEAAVVPSVETSVASIPAETPADTNKRERSLSPGEILSPSPGPETGIGMVLPDKAPEDPSALSREGSHASPVGHRRPGSPSYETGRHDRPWSSQSPPYRSGSGMYRYRFRSRSPDRYRRRSRSPPRRRYRRSRSRSRSTSPKSRYGKGSSLQSPGSRRWRPHSGSGRAESPPSARRSSRRRRSRSRSRSSSPRDRRGRGRRSRSVSPLARSRRPRSHSPPTHRKRSRSPVDRSSIRPYERERDRDGGRSDSRSRSGYSSSRALRRRSKSLSPPSPSRRRRRESASSESEGEMELLELKRQAIISMIGRDGPSGASDSKSEWEVVSVYESEQLPSGAEDASEPKDGTTIDSVPEGESSTDVRAGEETVSSGAEKSSEFAAKELSFSAVAQSTGSSEPAPAVSGDSERREDADKSREIKEKAAESLKEQKTEGKSAAQKPTKSVPSRGSGSSITVVSAGPLKSSEPSQPSTEPATQVKKVERAVTPVVEQPPKVAVGVAKLAARAPVRLRTPTSGPSSSTVSRQSSPSLSRPAVSVKVLSANDKTWDVQEFHIQVSSEESESSDSDSDLDQPVRRASHRAPPSGAGPDTLDDEISKMLTRVRREVEAKSRGAAPLSPPTFDPRLKLESTSSTDSLHLPSPPASLPLKQQREYIELQRKLALHERKKLRTEGEAAVRGSQAQGKEKGKAPISGGRYTKKVAKATKAQDSSHSGSESEKPSKRPRMKKSALKKSLAELTPTPTPTPTSTPPPEAEVSETERRAAEDSRGRIAEYESAIKSSRSHLESSQRQLTSLVHQLAECESEMEEHELKLELLRKQLKIVEEAHAGCTKKRSHLQDQVRSTRDRISRHSTAIQEVEKKLGEEREGRRRPLGREDASAAALNSAAAVKDASKPKAGRHSGAIGVQVVGGTESVSTGAASSSVIQPVLVEASKSLGASRHHVLADVGTAVTRSQTSSQSELLTLPSMALLHPEARARSPSSPSRQRLATLPMSATTVAAGLSPAVPEYEIISDAESQSGDVTCRDKSLAMSAPQCENTQSSFSSARLLLEDQHKATNPLSLLAVPSRQFGVEPVSDTEDCVPLSPLETEMVSDSEAAGPAGSQRGGYSSLVATERAHLPPLEMEMVSDSESQEPRFSLARPDSEATDMALKLPPTIEAISDSEDTEMKKLSVFCLSPEALDTSMDTGAEVPPIPPEAGAIKVISESDSKRTISRALEVEPGDDYQQGVSEVLNMSRYSPVQVEAITDSDSEVDIIEVSDPPASDGTASSKALCAVENTLVSNIPTTVNGLSQVDTYTELEVVSATFAASPVNTQGASAPLRTETLSVIEATNEQLTLTRIESVGATGVDTQPTLGSAGGETVIEVEAVKEDLPPPTNDTIVDTVFPPQQQTSGISSLKIASICSLCPSANLDDNSADTAFSLIPPSTFDDDQEASISGTIGNKDTVSRDEAESSVALSVQQLQREHSYSLSPEVFEILTMPPEPVPPTKRKRSTGDRSGSLSKEEHGVKESVTVPSPPAESRPAADKTLLPVRETSVGVVSQATKSSSIIESKSQKLNKRKSKPPKRLQLKRSRASPASSPSPLQPSFLSPALSSTLERTLYSALSPGLSALISPHRLAQILQSPVPSSGSLPGPGLYTCSSTVSSPGSEFPGDHETAVTQTLGGKGTSLEGRSASLRNKSPGVSLFLTSALMKTLQTVTVGNVMDGSSQCLEDLLQVVRNEEVSTSNAEAHAVTSVGKLSLGASRKNAQPSAAVSASAPSNPGVMRMKTLKPTSATAKKATSSSTNVFSKSQAFSSVTSIATSSHTSATRETSSVTAACITTSSHPHTPSSTCGARVAMVSASQSAPIPAVTVSSSARMILPAASVQSKSAGQVSVHGSVSLCPSSAGKPTVPAVTKVVFTLPVPHMQTGSGVQMTAACNLRASSSKTVTVTAPPVPCTNLTKSATTTLASSSRAPGRKTLAPLDVRSSASKTPSLVALATPPPTTGTALQTAVGLNFPSMVPLPLVSTQLGLKLPNWGSLLPSFGTSATVVAPVHSLPIANLASSNTCGVSMTVQSSTSTLPASTATVSTRSSAQPLVTAVPPSATPCPAPVPLSGLGSVRPSLLPPPHHAMTTSVTADSIISSLLTKLQSTALPSAIAVPILEAVAVTPSCTVQAQATASTTTTSLPSSAAVPANDPDSVLTPDGLFILPPSMSTTTPLLPRVGSDLPLEVHSSAVNEAALSLLTAGRDTRKGNKGTSLAVSDTSSTSTQVSSMPTKTPCSVVSGSGSTATHSTTLTSAGTASSASSPAASQVSKKETVGSLSTWPMDASSTQSFTSKALPRSAALPPSATVASARGEAVRPASNQERLVSGPKPSLKPSATKPGVTSKALLAVTSSVRRGSCPPFIQQSKPQPLKFFPASTRPSGMIPSVTATAVPSAADLNQERKGSLPLILSRSKLKTIKAPPSLASSAQSTSALPQGIIPLPAISTAAVSKRNLQGFSTEIQSFQEKLQKQLKEQKIRLAAAVQAQGGASQPVGSMLAKPLDKQESTSSTDAPLSSKPPSATPTVKESAHCQILPEKDFAPKVPDRSSSAPGKLTSGSERAVSSLTKQASGKDKPAKQVLRDTKSRSSSPGASRAASASTKQTTKPQPRGTTNQQTTTRQKRKGGMESGISEALKLLGVETPIEQLRQTWLPDSSQSSGLNVEEVLESVRPTPSLSSLLHPGRRIPLGGKSGKIATFSPPESTCIIPESVLSVAERLESGKALEAEKETQGTGNYEPYVSPLLAFRSYRLSPFYRTHAKLPLSSLTYSSKLKPERILCRFEQLGICNDAKCSAQHLKNIAPSREELVQDLVSYVPTIAGCSQGDLSTVDDNLPELQKEISGKIASFSTSLIQAYGGKITDEQLYVLTAHRVNEEIMKVNPSGRKSLSYAGWGERHWVSKQQGRTELRSGRPLASVPPDVEPSLVGVAEVGGGGMPALPPLGVQRRPALSSDPQRYFSQGERQRSRTAEDKVRERPSDVGTWLQLAGGASGHGKALGYLEEGLKNTASSEELWVEYLRMKSHDPSSSVKDLDAVCTRAVAASQSYAVVFECIILATTYDSKKKWLETGFRVLSTQYSSPPSSSTSHQHLELLLSASLLDQRCGRSQSAADTIHTALFASTRVGQEVPRHLTDLSSQLTQADRLLACLALIHLVYLGTLPASLFPSSSPEPPARIRTKEPFLVPWREEVELSQDKMEEIRQLFQVSLKLCSSTGVSPAAESLATTSSTNDPLRTQDSATTQTPPPANIQPPSDSQFPMDSENTHLPMDNQLPTSIQPPTTVQPPKILDFPASAEAPQTQPVPECLPLLQNLAIFEATHGSRQQAQAVIEGQLAAWPEAVEYWILLARLGENQEECRDILQTAMLHCPRRAELYYHAARLELSSQDTGKDSTVGLAVQWLEKGARQFYCTLEGQPVDVQHTLLLYRKLLGQLVPYDCPLPNLSSEVDPKQLKKQLVPLWMCYCLLVELTSSSNPAACSSEFCHYAAEDAFESAVHSVQEGEGLRLLWREYLSYVRSQALQGKSNVQNFKLFSDCVLRSLVAVESTRPFPHPLYGQPDCYHSHSFHNEVTELLLSCLPFTSGYKLAVLQRFSALFPRNPVLVARLVECALDQTPEQVKLAQGVLASYLATDPQCHFLWSILMHSLTGDEPGPSIQTAHPHGASRLAKRRRAISVELRLGHTREARWMYHQAVLALPLHAEIWKEFLLFELRELISSKSPTSTPILLLDVVKKTQEIGLNLRPFLKEALRMPSSQ